MEYALATTKRFAGERRTVRVMRLQYVYAGTSYPASSERTNRNEAEYGCASEVLEMNTATLRAALAAGLAPLAAWPQFILYRLAWNGAKWDKLPVNYQTMQVSNAHDPAAWMTADAACTLADMSGEGYGVGFVFTPGDPFVFIDIDACLSPDRSAWSALALTFLKVFEGAYVEISLSGNGLHVIASYRTIPPHACKNQALGLEIYHEGRFVALTGTGARGNAGFIV